jgi:uncharacterized repeat protein (TIGR01451 family)
VTGGECEIGSVPRIVFWAALLSAFAVALGAPVASASPSIQTIRNYDHSGTACASISTTRGTSGYYKTQAPNSVTGMAFNGTDLLYSCWGDGTITAIRPTANAVTYPKDTSVGAGGIYTVTGLPGAGTPGLGSLDWDAQHNVLWACNLSAFTGSQKKLGADIGYITLSSDGSGSATFTDVANAPDGCVNGIDYNPADSTVSATGALLKNSTKTVDQFVINSDLTAGAMTTWQPGKPLTPDGYVSGIEYSANGLFLADNHGTTKTLQYTSDLVTSTRLSSSSHRYEDVACDPVTFAPTVVVWVEWFDHNQAEPFQVPNNDSCTVTAPPPLSVTQDAPAPVMADAGLSYTVHVTNNGSGDQTNVVLTDTPPADTIFGSATASQGSCSTGVPVTCTLGSLTGNSSASVTVTVTPIKPGTYTNQASAVSDQAASQPSSQDATVTAEANVSYVSVDDGGISSATPAPSQGSIIQFDFFGTTNHDLTDSTGLFDTGVQTPISYVRQELDAAATYKITDSPSGHVGTIKISPTVVGPGPYTTSGFVIAWSFQPLPAGFDEDIQVQLPGSTTWTTWLMNQTGASATYTPANGTGTYKFRARLQKTGSTATAYSPAFKVSVSS